ncbi:hypothetical protein FRX31_013365 [Thalictrum thalictroides]|uniref:Uncharacterized protein n=1 Tax=Thalictrum thalictroides TaxID=46969 RepID=A0A7J6WJA3_THATH|nr:hypothetical protein FRX31_013365 [Thalictrum thalictroides]
MSGKKVKPIVDSDTSGKRTREMADSVTNIEMLEPIYCDDFGSYCEPGQVRGKGCGKRQKSGKEKAIGSAKESKRQLCTGCGQRGVGHDVRTCPKVVGVSLSQP